MQDNAATLVHLIRHAPVIGDGCVYGRRDLPADLRDHARFDQLRAQMPPMDHILSSPAQRCLQTAGRLWPERVPDTHADLWEQDFGDWEGLPFKDIPDHGRLDGPELARFAPPNGESFDDLCNRVAPVLSDLPEGDVAVMAHAGVIRAALSHALGGLPTALRFEIAPLSLTVLRRFRSGAFGIVGVNL